MILIENIIEIRKSNTKGYEIIYPDSKVIKLSKRRTIVGLLLLIKYQICSEEDLTGTNGRLKEVKQILRGKMPENWIQDRYGDANKPFSELWTEEMFTFIRAEGFKGNKKYVLDIEDHEKLFNSFAKVERRQLTQYEQKIILERQHFRCNFCGSMIRQEKNITTRVFAKDRVRLEFDHRVPIDRNGTSNIEDYQALCHYCNKCKRQMCYICELKNCDSTCALVNPENNVIVKATGEDISDRLTRIF